MRRARLATSPALAGLTWLRLAGRAFGRAGVSALAWSPWLKKLAHLGVSSNEIHPGDAELLLASPDLAACRRFDLQGCRLTVECKQDLRARFGDRLRLG